MTIKKTIGRGQWFISNLIDRNNCFAQVSTFLYKGLLRFHRSYVAPPSLNKVFNCGLILADKKNLVNNLVGSFEKIYK